MSATPDSTLANPEQRIADLERQLAERKAERDAYQAERDESEAQKTAMAEVLQVINSSPGDLAPVLDTLVRTVARLCRADRVGMYRRRDDAYHLIASHGISEKEFIRSHPLAIDRSTLSGRVAMERRPVHIPDVLQDPEYGYEAQKIAGYRSMLGVPLLRGDQLIGHFNMTRTRVDPFTSKEIELATTFADQAVIAIENARLITETREGLEQQTATAEVLRVINSSPGDLAPVFDSILDKAMRLCEAAFGMMTTFDGERFHPVSWLGLPAALSQYFTEGGGPSGSSGMHAHIISGAELVHVADMKDEEAYRSGYHTRRAFVDLGGARTGLAIALRKDGVLLGTFMLYRQEVRPFSDRQIALLQDFAAQAVIAMENARLITETREALEQQTATAEVLQVINSSPGDLTPVFYAILESAMHLCEAAFGELITYQDGRHQTAATRGVPAAFAEFRKREHVNPEPGSLGSRVLGGELIIHITDLKDEEVYRSGYANRRALVDLGGARTALIASLHKETTHLGFIILFRQEVRPFTEKQIALLQSFAAQAVIAMENARLITETREALEQQTATAEVLGVINSSPGDLGPVFDAMLEKAMRLCGAAFGELIIYDGERFETVATHGVPAVFAELRRRDHLVTVPGSLGARILDGAHIIHVADLKDEEVYRTGHPNRRALVDLGGARTALVASLRKDETLLGYIIIYRQEVLPFTDKQIALLQNFAAQAVIAMENARLITETREALEQQTATAEVLGVINASPGDLAPVFGAILQKAHALCEAAHGHLTIFDGDLFRIVAMQGIDAVAPPLAQPFPAIPSSLQERMLHGERLIHIADIADDTTSPGNVRRQMALEAGFHTVIFVPLRRDEVLIGYITAYRREVRPFTEKQIVLLQNFAAQAVIAMENARLLGELRQRTDQVAELNRGLEARVAEQVDELGRVGRLKRFLAPQLAELIVSQGDEKILESHRREIVVVFCDLRGYTAFTETAEPEEVLEFLRQYHGALGPLVSQFEGTLDQFSGDGIMVFFNDPVPCPDPAERAVKMAMAMREEAGKLIAAWRRHGSELGFGIGIAQGFATLGQIGFSDRSGYTAIGTVCNLAARLCAEAKDGQILVSSRIAEAVVAVARLEDLGNLELRGLRRPVAAFNVVQSTSAADARPNLIVVAREPGA